MLFIGTTAVISDIYVAQPILPVLKREFSVSPTVASLAVSLNIFALALTLLIYGPHGRQRMIHVGLITAAFGLLVSLWGSLSTSVAGLFLLCLGLFITQPAASALVGDKAQRNYGSASSLYLFFYYLGGSVGAATPGPIWDIWGWSGVVALCLCILMIALIALSTLCRE